MLSRQSSIGAGTGPLEISDQDCIEMAISAVEFSYGKYHFILCSEFRINDKYGITQYIILTICLEVCSEVFSIRASDIDDSMGWEAWESIHKELQPTVLFNVPFASAELPLLMDLKMIKSIFVA